MSNIPSELLTNGSLTPTIIVETVSRKLGVKSELTLSRHRTPRVAWARQIAMWYCRELLAYSYPEIGRIFRRDHSTIMSAVRHVEQVASLNCAFAEWLAARRNELLTLARN